MSIKVNAQQKHSSQPLGYFLEDSISLGTSCFYSLSLRHAPDVQVLFPDSSHSFAPFELIDHRYFPTRTDSLGSLDSVVYQLTTYEIDAKQTLKLPVFLINDKDCTTVYSRTDTILFKSLLENSAELSLKKLKANNEYEEVKSYFNFPYLISTILVLLTLSLIIWGLLGKQIRQSYRLFQFRTRQAIFIKEFGRLRSRNILQNIEKALSLWKKHLEYIESQPFSSYTTKEIIQVVADEELGKSLKNIDRAIYGQETAIDVKTSFDVLLHFAIRRFEQRREELRNA